MLRSCFLSSFVEFYSAGLEEKLKMSQQIIGQGRHFVFLIHLKNTNLVEGVEILLLIKFRQIPFTVSEEKSKMSQPIRGQGGHFVFSPICLKNTNLVEGIEILLPIKFHWIRFSGFREVENVSANQRPGQPSCFSDRPKKYKLDRGRLDLDSCQVLLNSIQRFQRRSHKISQPIRGQAAILFFSIGPKNTNLVEGVEILHPVKIRWILFSGFYREVKNVSANQKPGWPSCFSDPPKKHKLGRGLEILLPIKFCWIRFSSFRGEVENVSANQKPGRPSCFSDRPEKHKLGRGLEILLPVKFS